VWELEIVEHMRELMNNWVVVEEKDRWLWKLEEGVGLR